MEREILTGIDNHFGLGIVKVIREHDLHGEEQKVHLIRITTTGIKSTSTNARDKLSAYLRKTGFEVTEVEEDLDQYKASDVACFKRK